MLSGLKLLFAAAIGIALGLAATYAAVQRGVSFALRNAGPWVVAEGAGSEDADPYEQASLARRAEIPLGLGEGLSFVATADNAGASLSDRCDYTVSAEAPAARYWTLSVMSPQGRLIENAAKRYGFTSGEVLRARNGDFTIEISRWARPGNWLPLGPGASRFVLVLRLYDTPMAATANSLTADDMPKIIRTHCA